MVVRLGPQTLAEQMIRFDDREAGLEGVIVIHSTALGPGAGGCRLWTYPAFADAAEDATRLARGMSYKNALAGLPFGGAKAVLRRPSGTFDRKALFRAFGRAVANLGGCYVTAEDVGTSVADMTEVASVTRYVAGLNAAPGRAGGDPSPWTVQGVFDAMAAAASLTLGSDLGELRIAIQGVGSVGADLCRRLSRSGARLFIADVDREACLRLARQCGATIVEPDHILGLDVDVVAPCALGGVLNERSVDGLRARVVCGAANNQLEKPEIARHLQDRNIAYVPDFVANAGGIISVAGEYMGEAESGVATRVALIGPRVTTILEESRNRQVSPAFVADRMAEEIIAGVDREAA